MTDTVVYPNGTVVTQCSFNKYELAEEVTRVSVKGRLTADDGGRIEFRPVQPSEQCNLEEVEHTDEGYLLVYKKVMLMTLRLSRYMTHKQLDEAIDLECKRLKKVAKKYLIKKSK